MTDYVLGEGSPYIDGDVFELAEKYGTQEAMLDWSGETTVTAWVFSAVELQAFVSELRERWEKNSG